MEGTVPGTYERARCARRVAPAHGSTHATHDFCGFVLPVASPYHFHPPTCDSPSAAGLLPRCSAPDCACAEFLSQYYRPAQCVHCYHAIDVHAEGWALETAAAPDALPHYVHAASGARLATRLAGEPEPEPAAEDGVRASAGGEEAGA
ncbi:hypothetical protein EON66_02475, partial [archaeon]